VPPPSIILVGAISTFTFSGPGIINNSGIPQTITVTVAHGSPNGGSKVRFHNSASAGVLINFVVERGVCGGGASMVSFIDSSSADSATFLNEGATDPSSDGGSMLFAGDSSAANGIFTNEGATTARGAGLVQFRQNATADHGIFTNDALPAEGGAVQFLDSSTAAEGTFTNNGTFREGGAAARRNSLTLPRRAMRL